MFRLTFFTPAPGKPGAPGGPGGGGGPKRIRSKVKLNKKKKMGCNNSPFEIKRLFVMALLERSNSVYIVSGSESSYVFDCITDTDNIS